jgi:DNA-binding response OmpR family regulator
MGADARRVLIADADAGLRQQLYGALLEHDIFSDCVASTHDAVEKLARERYGLVVIDVALPHGDVEQVIARIHDMPAASRPVVLVLAAKPEAARTLDVEIVQIVLRRPVLLGQLVDLVRSCLRSAAASRPDPPKQSGNGDQLNK